MNQLMMDSLFPMAKVCCENDDYNNLLWIVRIVDENKSTYNLTFHAIST